MLGSFYFYENSRSFGGKDHRQGLDSAGSKVLKNSADLKGVLDCIISFINWEFTISNFHCTNRKASNTHSRLINMLINVSL